MSVGSVGGSTTRDLASDQAGRQALAQAGETRRETARAGAALPVGGDTAAAGAVAGRPGA